MTSRVSDKFAHIAPSATLAVTAKAKALNAAGEPVISFGAGEPDFATPDYIVQAAIEAAKDPRNHHYTATKGLPELRQAITQATQDSCGYYVDPECVLVTNGGKQAVFQAISSICGPGDEVILPAPYWTTYPEAIELAGATPVAVMASPENQYKVTINQLDSVKTKRTKALILCSPSNPTGSIYSPEETREIGHWALRNGVWVITDEIYQHLVYEGEFTPILREVPKLADTTIVLNGVAKTYAMTGWRVGWMIGPKDVIAAATSYQSHVTSHVNNIAQRAAVAALAGHGEQIETMRQAFDKRRKTILQMLRQIKGFKVPTATAAFYVFPDVTALIGTEVGGQVIESTSQLADVILEQVKVAVVPGEAFGAPGFLRLSYALGDEDLVEGVERLQQLFGTEDDK